MEGIEKQRMKRKICVLGDRFLLPDLFHDPIKRAVGDETSLTTHQLDWPDSETIAGSPGGAIREFSGRVEEVIEKAAGADALIVHMAPVPAQVFRALPQLKFLAVCRGGPVNVDVDSAAANGVYLVRAPGRNANAVAEFTVGALIGGTRSLVSGASETRSGIWSRGHYRYADSSAELCDMVVGLIGYSHIGRKVGKLLSAFGTKVLFSDPYQECDRADCANGVEKVSLGELCARADAVSLHARLTDETRKMCDKAFFNSLSAGSVFINTARGELVDEGALLMALHAGSVHTAILDTFDPEPPSSDSPLLLHPNVIATPHLAGASRTSAHIAAGMVAQDLGRWMRGEDSPNRVC